MKLTKRFKLIATVTLLSALLVACGSDPVQTTGFMSSYTGFKPHPEVEEAHYWVRSGEDISALGRYNKFIMTPIEVWQDRSSPYGGVSPDELKAITDYFRQALQREVGVKYPFVTDPGPDVAIVRLAITGVQRDEPKRSAMGYIPIALLISAGSGAAESIAGMETTVITASLEAELIDSMSGERMMALIDQQIGGEKQHKKGDGSFEQIQAVLDHWAQRFRNTLDKHH